MTRKQSTWVAVPAMVAPLIWVLLIIVAVCGLYFLLRLNTREWKKTLFVVIYLGVIWTVVTKV
ncbi:MAG: hypothetical protein HKN85_11510 [Gammaproteobacteria bacterium]|nr:hypothetical protein [Gammaproteobacteria bacterium]